MPPSSRRTLLLIAAIGMTLHGIILTLGGPILPSIMEGFALREARAGLLLASGSAGYLIGTLSGGFLIDRRGLKWAFLLGLGVEMLSLGLYTAALTFPVALAAGMMLGLGSGFIETTLNTLPARIPDSQAGSLMNLVHLFFSLGAFISPLIIGGLLESGWVWRTIYGVAIIPTVGLCLGVLGIRFPLAPDRTLLEKEENSRERCSENKKTQDTSRTLLRQRPVILGALVLLFYVGGELGISSWVVLYLQRELHLSVGVASAGLSSFWIAMMVGRYGLSRLALRFSERDLVIGSGLGGAISCWGLLTTRQPAVAFGWLALAGLLLAGVYPLAMASVNSRYPRFTGRVSGLLAACAASGSLLFPPLLGAVAQQTSLRMAMGLNGLWLVGVALSFSFMPRYTSSTGTELVRPA